MIQVFSNSLGEDELQAVRKVVESKWLGMGAECKAFEEELGQHFGSNRVLLMNNCTAAIFISVKALRIGRGDEVIVSSVNFNAVPSAVIDAGARPVFADVDPVTLNILPEEIDRLKNGKTKAVFLLHYGGHPAPVDDIQAVCGSRIQIIEDSANSVSSRYKGKMCGTLGDAGMCSFDAMKILVMGDGGVLIVRDEEVYKRATSLRYLGFPPTTTSGTDSLKSGKRRWWEFELENSSGRYISNDILASIGRVQLRKLPEFIERRKQIWEFYQRSLADVPEVQIPPEPLPGCTSSYYLYWLRVPGKRDELANYLKGRGIYSTYRYYPLHMIRYFGATDRLRNAEEVNESVLNLPLHQGLTNAQTELIVAEVRKFFGR